LKNRSEAHRTEKKTTVC